jgi:hypothetical protein
MCGEYFRGWAGVARNQSAELYKGTTKRLSVGRFTGGPV